MEGLAFPPVLWLVRASRIVAQQNPDSNRWESKVLSTTEAAAVGRRAYTGPRRPSGTRTFRRVISAAAKRFHTQKAGGTGPTTASAHPTAALSRVIRLTGIAGSLAACVVSPQPRPPPLSSPSVQDLPLLDLSPSAAQTSLRSQLQLLPEPPAVCYLPIACRPRCVPPLLPRAARARRLRVLLLQPHT